MRSTALRSLISTIVYALASSLLVFASGVDAADLEVKVRTIGEEIHANASLFVRAPRQRVWEVVTDYERAAEFMSDVELSKIISRRGDSVRVLEKDRVRWGPFSFLVETIKDVTLTPPFRTESRLVSGSMKKYRSTMELTSEAGGTRVRYESSAVPDSAMAAIAGDSVVRRLTEERFEQLRAEILRREQIAQRN